MNLTSEHRAYLNAYAITDETIEARGIRSGAWGELSGILFPWTDADGRRVWQLRPDNPPVDDDGEPKKYLFGRGKTPPLNYLRQAANGDPRLIVEGTKQSHSAHSWARPSWGVVGMNGCNGWHGQDLSGFEGADVGVIFDKDVTTNPRVHDEATQLYHALTNAGAKSVRFPMLDGEGADGLDDVLSRMPKPDRQRYLVKIFNEATPGNLPDFVGSDGTTRDGREKLNISSKEVAARVLREKIGTGELAGLFHRGGELVHTPRIGQTGYVPPKDGEDGPAQVRVMSALELKTRVEIRYAVGKNRERQRKTTADDGTETTETAREWEPSLLPLEVATHAHTAARANDGVPNLRTLAGVTHTPVMRPDGSVVDAPGYDSATRLLYLPDVGLSVPPVPDRPTSADVKAAVELLSVPVAEFPFVEDYHRANWFGALFTPVLRPLLPPPYAMPVIDAPSPGSGKGYLAGALRVVHGGILRTELPRDEAELEKALIAILTGTTAPVVTFDNVRGKIHSAKLEGLLTAREVSGRYLGHSREVTAPNDRLWTMTANNAEIGGDLARRCLWITIDPRMPRPQDRTGFKIDFVPWVHENRGAMLHAMLTIARAWVLDGKPLSDSGRSDDYARWISGIRGMLTWAGFPGEFGRTDTKHAESADDQEWGTFLAELRRVFGDRPFKVRDITDQLTRAARSPLTGEGIDPDALPGDLAEKWSKTRPDALAGFTKTLGWWIKNRVGRYPDGAHTIQGEGDAKRGTTYRVIAWEGG